MDVSSRKSTEASGTISPRTDALNNIEKSMSGTRYDRSRRANVVAARRAASETFIYARGDDSFAWNMREKALNGAFGSSFLYGGSQLEKAGHNSGREAAMDGSAGKGGLTQRLRGLAIPEASLKRLKKHAELKSHYKIFVEGTHVFEPRSQPLLTWMFISMTATVWASISTPVELTWFIDPNKWASTAYFLVTNVIVTIVFFLDIFVYSNLAYHDTNDRALLVTSRVRIMKRYAKFWLWIDFCSAFPFELLAQQDSMVLRLLKLLRLGRALRLLNSSSILRPFEAEHSVHYGTLSLATIGAVLLLLTHLMGCFLFLAARLVGDMEYFIEANRNNISLNDVGEQWLFGVYWAAMTVSTIGYGDVQLTSNAQRAYAVACMMVGSSAWAYLVGALIQVMISMDKVEVQRREIMSDVTGLSQAVGLPADERARLRLFFSKTDMCDQSVLQRYQELLRRMSPVHAVAVVKHMMQSWLYNVWWLHSHDKNFLLRLAFCLRAQSFGPWETVFRHRDTANTLYFVRDGSVLVLHPGYLFAKGQGVGIEMILPRRQSYGYTAVSSLLKYTSLWRLEKDEFRELIKSFPPIAARVRWAALAVFLKRGDDPRRLVDVIWRGYHHHYGTRGGGSGGGGHGGASSRRSISSDSEHQSGYAHDGGGVNGHVSGYGNGHGGHTSGGSAVGHHGGYNGGYYGEVKVPKSAHHARTLQDLLTEPGGPPAKWALPRPLPHGQGFLPPAPAGATVAAAVTATAAPAAAGDGDTSHSYDLSARPPAKRGIAGSDTGIVAATGGSCSSSSSSGRGHDPITVRVGSRIDPGGTEGPENLQLLAVPPSPRRCEPISDAAGAAGSATEAAVVAAAPAAVAGEAMAAACAESASPAGQWNSVLARGGSGSDSSGRSSGSGGSGSKIGMRSVSSDPTWASTHQAAGDSGGGCEHLGTAAASYATPGPAVMGPARGSNRPHEMFAGQFSLSTMLSAGSEVYDVLPPLPTDEPPTPTPAALREQPFTGQQRPVEYELRREPWQQQQRQQQPPSSPLAVPSAATGPAARATETAAGAPSAGSAAAVDDAAAAAAAVEEAETRSPSLPPGAAGNRAAEGATGEAALKEGASQDSKGFNLRFWRR